MSLPAFEAHIFLQIEQAYLQKNRRNTKVFIINDRRASCFICVSYNCLTLSLSSNVLFHVFLLCPDLLYLWWSCCQSMNPLASMSSAYPMSLKLYLSTNDYNYFSQRIRQRHCHYGHRAGCWCRWSLYSICTYGSMLQVRNSRTKKDVNLCILHTRKVRPWWNRTSSIIQSASLSGR